MLRRILFFLCLLCSVGFGQTASLLQIPHGGTGLASTTAYALMFGGTTSTAPLQQIGLGSSGQLLVSGGAGILPSWLSIVGGGIKAYSNTDVTGNTVANTNAETAFTSSYTIAANTVAAGDVIRLKIWGVYSTAIAPPNITVKCKLGSTTVLSTGPITAVGSIVNSGFFMDVSLSFFTVGASGTMDAQGYGEYGTAATTGLSVNVPSTGTQTIDNTTNQVLTVTVTWSAASTSNTITCREFNVEWLRAQGNSTPVIVSQGGTGATTLGANDILYGNGTAAIQANSGLTYNGSTTVGIGSSGNTGILNLLGTSSGTLSLTVNSGAGTNTMILPSSMGTNHKYQALTDTSGTGKLAFVGGYTTYPVTMTTDSNTTAEDTIFAVSIPAGDVLDGDEIDFTYPCRVGNNTGSTQGDTLRMYWGTNSVIIGAVGIINGGVAGRASRAIVITRAGTSLMATNAPFSNTSSAIVDNYSGVAGGVLSGQTFPHAAIRLAITSKLASASGTLFLSPITVRCEKKSH